MRICDLITAVVHMMLPLALDMKIKKIDFLLYTSQQFKSNECRRGVGWVEVSLHL